jgi:hypothetical protein
MGRLIQVLGFLMNKSRMAIKTGRITLLLSPEGHFDVLCPSTGRLGVGCRSTEITSNAESTIQRRSTNGRVYRSRGQVVRRIGCSGYVGPFHLEAL